MGTSQKAGKSSLSWHLILFTKREIAECDFLLENCQMTNAEGCIDLLTVKHLKWISAFLWLRNGWYVSLLLKAGVVQDQWAGDWTGLGRDVRGKLLNCLALHLALHRNQANRSKLRPLPLIHSTIFLACTENSALKWSLSEAGESKRAK